MRFNMIDENNFNKINVFEYPYLHRLIDGSDNISDGSIYSKEPYKFYILNKRHFLTVTKSNPIRRITVSLEFYVQYQAWDVVLFKIISKDLGIDKSVFVEHCNWSLISNYIKDLIDCPRIEVDIDDFVYTTLRQYYMEAEKEKNGSSSYYGEINNYNR